jgi:hypothetical protein
MPKFKSLPILAGAAAALLLSSAAHADLVLAGATAADSFLDLKAQGFGNNPRLLTLQTNNPFESGSATPNLANIGEPIITGDAQANGGENKSNTPTLSALGWSSGANVGIGLNTNQTGNTGITLDTAVLTIFKADGTSTGVSFSLASAIDFSAADVKLETGNGAAVFNFKLTAAEQTAFDNIPGLSGSFFAGLSSSFGCDATHFTGCLGPANDGTESWIGFNQAAVPAPLIGHGLLVLLAIGGVLFGGKLLESFKKHRLQAV